MQINQVYNKIRIILICIIFFYSGCDTEPNVIKEDFTFIMNETIIVSGDDANCTVSLFCTADNGIHYAVLSKSALVNETNTLQIISIYEEKVLNRKEIYSSPDITMNCMAIYFKLNDNIIIINNRINQSNPMEAIYYINEYDSDFNLVSETLIDNVIIKEMGAIYNCTVLDDLYYFVCENGVYVMGNEYFTSGFLELNLPTKDNGFYEILDIKSSYNEDIYVFCQGNYNKLLNDNFCKMIKIDTETLKAEKEINLDGELQIHKFVTGEDKYIFYGSNNDYIYGITDEGLIIKISSSDDYSYDAFGNFGSGINNNGYINYLYTNYVEDNTELILVTLEKKYNYDNPENELIMTVAGDLRQEWQIAVKEFNRKNNEHKIIIDILSYEGNPIDAFNTAIISDTLGDIIIPPENNKQYTSKKLYTDYYDFLKSDIDIKKEDFFPNLLSAMEDENGKIYEFWTNFGIETTVSPMQLFNEKGISFNKIYELMKSNPDKLVHPVMTDSILMLEWLLDYNYNYFVDTELNKCNFNGIDMQKALEISAVSPSFVPANLDDIALRFIDDMGILNDMIIYDIDNYIEVRDGYFGGEYDINIVGMPSPDGRIINNLNGEGFKICINSGSNKKEAAWEYIKMLLLDDKNDLWFPVIESVFDSKAKRIVENNKILIDKNGSYFSTSHMNINGVDFKLKLSDETDFETVKNLIQNSNFSDKFNVNVMNIIKEEAPAYFSGNKTIENVMNIIQNRVSIYLEELS